MKEASEGEAYYRLLFEYSPLPAFVFDRETLRFLDVNEAAIRNYGYSRAEFLNLTLKDIRPPEDVPKLLKLLAQPPRATQLSEPWRHQTKDGSIIAVEIHTFPVIFQQRQATVVTAQDVTLRRQIEQSLRASERHYRELSEKANDAIYTHDLRGNFTSMNEAGERFLGYSHDEFLTMNITQVVLPEDLEQTQQMTQRKLSGDLTNTVYEVRVRTKAGQQLTAEISSTVIYQDGKPIGVQGIARDMTERKRMEEQIRQVQKMNAVGRLAGGVAHDFNNRLTVIMGFTDLLLKRTPAHDQCRYYLEQIKHTSERATELTRQLLTFSRPQIAPPQVLNLNEAASEWANLVRVLLSENIEIQIILGSEVGLVKADPGQLEHVMMNLAINACDAMPEGGAFVIETTDIEISELQAQFQPAIPPGNYVRLTIRDNGCGMSEETLSHLFEPFFTTKDRSKGTGLGLFTAYGIIKQSGGYIEVKSALREGTTFLIYLPVVSDAQAVAPSKAPVAARPLQRETVLLVEDDPLVRTLVQEVLEGAGYTVLEAAQGQAALAHAQQHTGHIDLLLTDVRMPGLNGFDVAERLRALRPATRVLLMSAYTDDVRLQTLAPTTDFAFLQKPFTVEALIQQVRAVLERDKGKASAMA